MYIIRELNLITHSPANKSQEENMMNLAQQIYAIKRALIMKWYVI